MMRADKSKMKADESRRVTIIIRELGFSSDLGFQKTLDRKQHKYTPLMKELEREGWNVRPTVHVITVVGVRATLGADKKCGGRCSRRASVLRRSQRNRKSKPAWCM